MLGVFSLGTQAYALDFFPSTQSATSSTISNFSGNLYFGMRNNDVTRLQTFLISHNLLGANLNTGFFGLSTFNALRAYQNAVGVPATGFFGPLTRAALNAGRSLNINPAARVVVATSTATSTVIATTTTSTVVSTATSTQSTIIASTSTPPATVLPPVIPSAALIVKGQICTRLGAEWSLTANSISGAVGTCMFRAGTSGQTEALQQLTCQQLRGTYNECLSSCSSSSATATMCNAVCTPGCTNIR
jgi:Putative peptidoglycan binding domain